MKFTYFKTLNCTKLFYYFCLVYVKNEVILLSIDKNVTDQTPVARLIPTLNETQDGSIVKVYLMMMVLSWVETQSWVYRVKSLGAEAAALW